MGKQLSLLMPALLAIGLTLGACIRPATTPEAGEPAEVESTVSLGNMPDSLTAIEADAEDIMEFVPEGDWARIQTDTTHMSDAWQAYLPQAATDDVTPEVQTAMSDALAGLQAAVQGQAASTTLQTANDVSAAVVELFAHYDSATPADIGRLDVLGRQIILDVAAGDWAKAEATLNKTHEVWERVKPSALEHKGNKAAAQYDASLVAQAAWLKTKNVEELTTEAMNGLEIVDALEQVYVAA
jgi:hypothetical protein